MLATHILTHISQHTLWLVKIHMSPTKSCGSHVNSNKSKRVCWKVCVKMCVASISLNINTRSCKEGHIFSIWNTNRLFSIKEMFQYFDDKLLPTLQWMLQFQLQYCNVNKYIVFEVYSPTSVIFVWWPNMRCY